MIHSTAIVHDGALIGEGSNVGPYAEIGPNVVIGKNCEIHGHVVITGHTTIGDQAKIFPFAVIGAEPQHLQYKGEPTRVTIGHRVMIRESVTIHRGTEFGGGVTSVGDDVMLMAYTHVAHDCHVGRNVIMANAVQLAGHVVIEDFVFVGGQTGVIQFCRVGRYSYIGGSSILRKDLPPFVLGKGNEFRVQGINSIGLEKRGFSSTTITRLRRLFKIFYLQGLTINQAIEKTTLELGDGDEIRVFLDFIRSSRAGIIRRV